MPLWTLEDGIHVGDIIKPHSYLGAVKVAFLFSGLDKIIKPKHFIFIEFMEKPVPFLIESLQWQDDTTAIIRFVDTDSDVRAENLRDRKIIIPESSISAVQRREMQPPESFITYSVKDIKGNYLGIIEEVIENSAQTLFQVAMGDKSFLIPVHEDLIAEILPDEKVIIVDLPEGLLDINE